MVWRVWFRDAEDGDFAVVKGVACVADEFESEPEGFLVACEREKGDLLEDGAGKVIGKRHEEEGMI